MTIKPSKTRTIAKNAFKSSEVSRHEIGLIFELPLDVDVMQCFDKPAKTCQNILWFCKHGQKAENVWWKSFST